MLKTKEAIGITLFESDEFGGPKICGGGICPTQRANKVCCGVIEVMEMESERIGGLYDGRTNTLSTVQKDNYICVAMRGRNPTNPSNRTPGIELEQTLEVNTNGTSNCLTSVQKDNLVLENVMAIDEQNMNVRTETFGTLTTDGSSPKHNNSVMIKQATKQGYIECNVGGVADFSYPDSQTRRGRVQGNGEISPTLTAENQDTCKIEKVGQISNDGSQYGTVISDSGLSPNLVAGTHRYANSCIATQYRIRKLTPRECWRLMDFSDKDFEKAEKVNSNTQLYKQAGNSIVVNVLVAILGQLLLGKENVYREINE